MGAETGYLCNLTTKENEPKQRVQKAELGIKLAVVNKAAHMKMKGKKRENELAYLGKRGSN